MKIIKRVNSLVAVVASGLLFSSCNSYIEIISFYKKNPQLHEAIADTLFAYVKENHTTITLRQKFDDKSVSFGYSFKEISTQVGIGFDSLFNRIDYDERTKNIYVPTKLIREFRSTIYFAIITLDEGIFFGYRYKQLSELVNGILIYKDESKIDNKNLIKKIAPEVCIYQAVIP